MMQGKLQGKLVIISGGSRGIGFAMIKQLINQGAIIASCARQIDSIQDWLQQQEIPSERYYLEALDVCDTNAIKQFIVSANQRLGPPNILINNVGVNSARANIETIKLDDLDYMYQVNMRAPLCFMQESVKLMKQAKQPAKIINIHSTVCLFANPGIAVYTGTKSGFSAMTQVFRKELRDQKIQVLDVYPGGVNTDFRESPRADYLKPDDVATTIIQQLLLPESVYLDKLELRPEVERNF